MKCTWLERAQAMRSGLWRRWLGYGALVVVATFGVLLAHELYLEHVVRPQARAREKKEAAEAALPRPKWLRGDRNTECGHGNDSNLVYLRMASQRLAIPCGAFRQSERIESDGSFSQLEVSITVLRSGALIDYTDFAIGPSNPNGSYQVQLGVPKKGDGKWIFIEKDLDKSGYTKLRDGVIYRPSGPLGALLSTDFKDARGRSVIIECWGDRYEADERAKYSGLPFSNCRFMWAIKSDVLIWVQTGDATQEFLRTLPRSLVALNDRVLEYFPATVQPGSALTQIQKPFKRSSFPTAPFADGPPLVQLALDNWEARHAR